MAKSKLIIPIVAEWYEGDELCPTYMWLAFFDVWENGQSLELVLHDTSPTMRATKFLQLDRSNRFAKTAVQRYGNLFLQPGNVNNLEVTKLLHEKMRLKKKR